MKTAPPARDHFSALRAAALFGALFALGAGTAGAVTTQWTNDGTDFDWSNAANWSNAVPASGSDVLFDTAGTGTVLVTGTVTAHTLQIGNEDDAGNFQIGASAGSGTIDLTAAGAAAGSGTATGNTAIVNDFDTGSANETINSNLVLGSGYDNGTTAIGYGINSFSSGNLTFNGGITLGTTGTGAVSLDIFNSGTGNMTFNGNVTLQATANGSNVNVSTSVGTTVTFAGNNTFGIGSANNSGINLGTSATSVDGNLVLKSNGAAGGARINVWGTEGTLQVDTAASGSPMLAGNNSWLFMMNGRTPGDESHAHLENVSGNNTFSNVDLGHNTQDVETDPSTPTSYYVKSDAGVLTIGALVDLQVANQTKNGDGTLTDNPVNYQQVYLYGNGNGIITGAIDAKNNTDDLNRMSVVKDGSGTWAFTSAGGVTYTGGTTIQGGTLLVDNTSGSGTGTRAVTVNSSLGSGNAVLGGKGIVTGAVTVLDGGAINPGDIVGFNGATSSIGTLTLRSGLTVGAAGGAANAGKLIFEFNSDNGASDMLAVTGTLNLLNATLSLSDLGSSTVALGTVFDLASYTTLTGSFANFDNQFTVINGNTYLTLGSNTFELDYTTGGQNIISLEAVQAVPEPGTFALIGLGAAVLFLRLRAMRRANA